MENFKIVCPECANVNTIKTDTTPSLTCSQCKKLLAKSSPTEVNDENCAININENDIPVLVDFYSPSCAPCMEMADDYEGAAFGYALKVRFLKINTDYFKKVAIENKINNLPTIIAFKHGKEVKRVSGTLSQHEISQWAKSLIE